MERALENWSSPTESSPEQPIAVVLEEPREGHNLLAALPRPEGLGVTWEGSVSPPRKDEETFKAEFFRALARFPIWFFLAFRWLLAIAWTWLAERDFQERRRLRAVSLRELLQAAGPTAIKFGQQMSLRIDLIPYGYALELDRLLDEMPAFPVEQAIETIERTTGKELGATFATFDPNPIGSASIACVYQAERHNGDKVAVKVRRPGIGRTLAADLRALRWMLWFLELVYLPPGFTRNLLIELETMLTEELDFLREARSTDLFRRDAKRGKQRYVTSPVVHFDLCSREVLVEEYVSGGYWLGEVIKAVESQDQRALSELERSRIDPKLVARRLLKINRFAGFEALFFHADLHPANVLVKPGSKLVFIDFGSVGAFTKEDLISWRRLLHAQSAKDVGSMVTAALAVIAPLPPMDIEDFKRRLEAIFFQDLYAMESKHSKWWERTSANIWIRFLRLSREFGASMNLNTLKQIRGTMLVDTVAARLDRKVDHYREFRRYERQAGKRAAKRLAKRVRRDLFGPRLFVRLEQILDFAETAFYRTQRLVAVDDPRLLFARMVRKAALAATLAISTLIRLSLVGLAGSLAIYVGKGLEQPKGLGKILLSEDAWKRIWWSRFDDGYLLVDLWTIVLGSPAIQLLGVIVILVLGRRLLYRLRQVDIED